MHDLVAGQENLKRFILPEINSLINLSTRPTTERSCPSAHANCSEILTAPTARAHRPIGQLSSFFGQTANVAVQTHQIAEIMWAGLKHRPIRDKMTCLH